MDEASHAPPVASRKREAVVNLFFHYVAIALVIVQGIVLTPLYLHFLSPALYGGWLATGNIVSWIGLVDPGVSRIMQQRVAHTFGRGDMAALRAVLGTGLLLGSLLSMIPLVALPFGGMITGTLSLAPSEHTELTQAFRFAVLGTALMIAGYQPAAANLAIHRGFFAGISYTTGGIVGIAVTVSLLFLGFGLSSLPLGMIVRAVIMLFGNSMSLWAWTTRHLPRSLVVHRTEVAQYARLSAFTFVERVGGALLSHSDAYLTARLISPDQATVYALTGRAYDPVRMAAERIAPAFLPGLAHLAGEGRRERLYEISKRLCDSLTFIISVGAAAVVALNFAFVPLWVGPKFFGGQSLTVMLACFVVTNVILSSLAEIVFAAGGVGRIEAMRAVEGLVRVIAQYVMLKWIGIVGIPIGGCVGMLVVSAWYLPRVAAERLEQKQSVVYWQIAVSGFRAAVLLACGGFLGWLLRRNVPDWNWLIFIVTSIFIFVFLCAIGLAMNPDVRSEVCRLYNRLRRPIGR